MIEKEGSQARRRHTWRLTQGKSSGKRCRDDDRAGGLARRKRGCSVSNEVRPR